MKKWISIKIKVKYLKMNVKINLKKTFLNELKKSNIKLCDFCQQKKLNRNLINKILIKSTWSSLFTENENVFFHVIENWLIDKQNKRAKRETLTSKNWSLNLLNIPIKMLFLIS